jgi:hypothetical protein
VAVREQAERELENWRLDLKKVYKMKHRKSKKYKI